MVGLVFELVFVFGLECVVGVNVWVRVWLVSQVKVGLEVRDVYCEVQGVYCEVRDVYREDHI